MMQPQSQQAAAHMCGTAVEYRKQRGRLFAAQSLRNLQIPPRGRIHADILLFAFQT